MGTGSNRCHHGYLRSHDLRGPTSGTGPPTTPLDNRVPSSLSEPDTDTLPDHCIPLFGSGVSKPTLHSELVLPTYATRNDTEEDPNLSSQEIGPRCKCYK